MYLPFVRYQNFTQRVMSQILPVRNLARKLLFYNSHHNDDFYNPIPQETAVPNIQQIYEDLSPITYPTLPNSYEQEHNGFQHFDTMPIQSHFIPNIPKFELSEQFLDEKIPSGLDSDSLEIQQAISEVAHSDTQHILEPAMAPGLEGIVEFQSPTEMDMPQSIDMTLEQRLEEPFMNPLFNSFNPM